MIIRARIIIDFGMQSSMLYTCLTQRRSLKIANDTSFDLFPIVFLLLSACVRSHGDHIASISPAGMVTCDFGYEYLDGQPVCNGTTKVGSCTRKL